MSSVAQTFAGLNRTAVLGADGNISWQWFKGFNALAQAANAPAATGPIPASSDSPGLAGQIVAGGGFIYVCIETNLWLRAALSAF
jgi:hypothetical protein